MFTLGFHTKNDNKETKMTSDQWFAVVMIAVSAFLGWCVTMAVYDIALWGAA